MKRKKIKRKVLAFTLSMAMAITTVMSLSMNALAGGAKYEGTGVYDGSNTATMIDKINTETGEPYSKEISIPVQAQLLGAGGIVYNVAISWGDMQFQYDYGDTWDPETHSYVPGQSGKVGGGWMLSFINGAFTPATHTATGNNYIYVKNESNFPIDVNFAYAHEGGTNPFNPSGDPAVGYAVGGVFDYSNSALQTAVDNNNTDPASKAVPTPMHLNTDKSKLTTGKVYYYQETDNGEYDNAIFFALMGTPEAGLTMDGWTGVGSITATLSAATGVTKATK